MIAGLRTANGEWLPGRRGLEKVSNILLFTFELYWILLDFIELYWIYIILKGTRNLLGKLRSSNGPVRQVSPFLPEIFFSSANHL